MINLEEFENLIGPTTKAALLVNPNNPTGSYVHQDELKGINDICKRKGLVLICDEVFWDFPLKNDEERISFVNNEQVLTFTLGGISKTLGLPQMKLSWMIISGPKSLVEKAQARLEIIGDTYLSVGTPTQNSLERWFQCKDAIQKGIRQRIQHNLDFLQLQVKESLNCELLNIEGGWYAVLKIPEINEEQWVLELLKNDHVFVHPGYFFDFDSEGYIILSLLPVCDTFKKGINRLFKRLKASYFDQSMQCENLSKKLFYNEK